MLLRCTATYVTVVLGRIPHGSSTVESIQHDVLPSQPPARVQAAKDALEDFKVAGVQLTALTKVVDAALPGSTQRPEL